MNELSNLRTETSKTFELDPKAGRGQYQLEARTGPCHYLPYDEPGKPGNWQDLDETYSEASEIKGIGKVLVYPRLPNIISIFQDRCGYQIQSRSNRDHVATVELVSIDGQEVTSWQNSADLRTYAKVHPYRVGIWKELATARTKATTMRWRVTEVGSNAKDSHPFAFRDTPDAFNTASLTNLSPAGREAAKVAIETAKTRIDGVSWYWDEIVPVEAKLVDTDFQVGAGGDDGCWVGTSVFYPSFGSNNMGDDGGVSHYNSWARFQSVTIPPGSMIASCVMSFYPASDRTVTTCTINFSFEDADNPSAPSSATDANGRSKTSAVSQNLPAWYTGTWYSTNSMVTQCQAVINRAGWASGNAIQGFGIESGSSSSGAIRDFVSYETSSSTSPKLVITWTGHPAIRRFGGFPHIRRIYQDIRIF